VRESEGEKQEKSEKAHGEVVTDGGTIGKVEAGVVIFSLLSGARAGL